MDILISPSIPISLKFTAQGYRKITSISKSTNKMATRKYFTEKGTRAFPTDSIPHSKLRSLFRDLRDGPKYPEIMIVPTTKPTASMNCINIGK